MSTCCPHGKVPPCGEGGRACKCVSWSVACLTWIRVVTGALRVRADRAQLPERQHGAHAALPALRPALDRAGRHTGHAQGVQHDQAGASSGAFRVYSLGF